MERWCGKVAIVSGASSGIGAAIACKLVEDGMKVVGLARRVEKIEELGKKLANKKGKLYACRADVTKEQDILNAFKYTCEKVGPVAVLVNNAGIFAQTTLIDGSTELWRSTFETNVIGMLVASREAIKCMRKHNIDGHIVNINSTAGHFYLKLAGMNVYGAAKTAVTHITEVLRAELVAQKSKIRITSVSPGPVRTDIFEPMKKDPAGKQFIEQMAMLKAEDVAEAVEFAISRPPHVQMHEMMIRPTGEI